MRQRVPDMVTNERYRPVAYLADGMKLITPVKVDGKWTGMRVTVAAAHGDMARVVNEKRGFDAWRYLHEVRSEVEHG